MSLVDKHNKSRTSITINPELWKQAKDYCAANANANGVKMSFSEVVEMALVKFFLEETK